MSQTNKVIVFCVESNKKSKTDALYINHVFNQLYQDSNEIVRRFVYLGSKTNYNSRSVKKEIEDYTKHASEKAVIYFLDTDKIYLSPDVIRFNQEISDFCNEHGFLIVWFCKDIEDVFLHKDIEDNQKHTEAVNFSKQLGFGKATLNSLSVNDPQNRQKSNFLIVLDDYFERKN